MDIFIDIRARFAQFNDSLDKIRRDTERTVKGIEHQFKSLNSGLKVLALGFGAREIGGFVANVVNAADELNTLHERTGIAAEDLVGLQFAAQQSGANLDDLASGLKKLQKSISEAGTGNKELKQLFTDLGMTEAAAGAEDATEAMLKLAEVFPRLSQNDQTRVAMDLMGRSADSLVPAFRNGRKALEDFINEGKATGKGLADISRDADELKDKLAAFKLAADSAAAVFLKTLLPSLTETAKAMAAVTREGGVLLGLLRGFAGLGKLPFDLLIPKASDVQQTTGRIAELKTEAQALQNLREGKGQTTRTDEQLANRKAAIEREIGILEGRLKGQQAPADKGTEPPKPPPLKLTGGGGGKSGGSSKKDIDDFQRALKSLRDELGRVDAAGSKIRETLADIPDIEAKLGRKLTDNERGQLLDVAARIEMLKVEKDLREEIEAITARQAEAERNAREGVDEMRFTATLAGKSEEDRRFAEEQKRLATAVGETSDAYRELLPLIEQTVYAEAGAKVFEATRTEAERAATEIERLQKLFERGFISADTLKRGVTQAKEGLDEMTEFFRQAARNIQDAFADGLFNLMEGKFEDVGKNFKRTIDRMVANLLAAQLGKKLLGDFDKTGQVGGWIGDLIKNLPSFGGATAGGEAGKAIASAAGPLVGDAATAASAATTTASVTAFSAALLPATAGLTALDAAALPLTPSFLALTAAAEAAAAALANAAASSAVSAGFAKGGVMTSRGPLPLASYAFGGVARSPQLALFGEGSTAEAFVPLPDGRSIPVSMKGGGGGVNVSMTVVTPDANSFRASTDQIVGNLQRAARRVSVRNL